MDSARSRSEDYFSEDASAYNIHRSISSWQETVTEWERERYERSV